MIANVITYRPKKGSIWTTEYINVLKKDNFCSTAKEMFHLGIKGFYMQMKWFYNMERIWREAKNPKDQKC